MVDQAELASLWVFIAHTHDLRHVLAAAAVCVLAATAGFGALRFAETARRPRGWVLTAAAAFAAGVWTTHFLAMVGFRPDVALGFTHVSIVLSALAALLAGGVLACGARSMRRWADLRGGLFACAAVAVMHHAGVAGISGCVTQASFGPALLGTVIGAGFFIAALRLRRWRGAGLAAPALAMTLGVAMLHFVWMSGVALTRIGEIPVSGLTRADIAPLTLVLALALASLLVGIAFAQAGAGRDVRRLAAAASGSRDGVLILDSRGRAEWINPAFAEMTGLDLARLRRLRPLAALAGEGPDAAAMAELGDALARRAPLRRELRLREDAGGRWVNASVAPLPDGEGAVLTLHDLTEVRARAAAAEQARVEAEQVRARLLAALEVAPIGMAMFDPALRMIACNDAYRALMPGFEEVLAPGASLAAAAAAPEVVSCERAMLEAADGAEEERRLPDGRWVWRRAERAPGGEIMAARLDVTERKARESELEAARDAAQIASRAKSEFISVMSHELRTPLNGVLGFAGILAGSTLDEKQRACVERIAESGEALLGTLNDILDLAALDAERLSLSSGRVDLERLLAALRAAHGPAASAKGLAFDVSRDADAPEAVAGDHERLAQLLGKLIDNAIKFTETGAVRLRVRSGRRDIKGVELTYEVSDTGPGVSPEAVARLFDAFAQADGSMTRRFGGVGLGLAIAIRLARLMGGDIALEGAPLRGARFAVRIPHGHAGAAEARAPLRFGAVRGAA